MEMVFVEARYKGRLSDKFVEDIRKAIEPYKKINLVAAIQYIDQMNDFRKRAAEKVFVVKQSFYRAKYPGQILGCDVQAADCPDCDATLAFTQGIFHVLGIPVRYGKSVINADPETETVTVIDAKIAEKYRKRVLQGVGLALKARCVVFIESTKAGQTYGVKLLKEALKKRGTKIYSIVSDEINFSRLNDFTTVDVFINTACQRIGIDDMDKITKPIINAEDLEPYLLEFSK